MTARQNTRLGILLTLAATLVFSAQDAISRHLAGQTSVVMIVMIRFWFFAAFALWWAARKEGGIARAARAGFPRLQALRGVLLAAQICLAIYCFRTFGIVNTVAVFMANPLLVAALSGPVLGERVGWRRWLAIAAGFVGVTVILAPGAAALSGLALLPFLGAAMFAVYALLTRYVASRDSAATSLLWTGVAGAVAVTPFGLWFWQPMAPADWGWMAVLCMTGVAGHFLLIKSYEVAEASAVQPFIYFQLVFGAAIAWAAFGETVAPNVALGAAIVVGAGLFTFWRERVRGASRPRPPAPPG